MLALRPLFPGWRQSVVQIIDGVGQQVGDFG